MPARHDHQQLRASALHLADQGNLEDAIPLLHRHLDAYPHDTHALYALGTGYLRIGHPRFAESLLGHLARSAPTPEALNAYGFALAALNRLEEARDAYRAALKLAPDYTAALSNLSDIHKFRRDDPLLGRLKKRLMRRDLSPSERQILHFARAKAENDLGKWDTAFRAAKAGAGANMPDYDVEAAERAHQWQLDSFTAEALEPRQGRGSKTDIPVFLVGMPRTGTTLMSQILSCHSQVAAVGELDVISRLASQWAEIDRPPETGSSGPDWLASIPDARILHDAATYLSELSRRPEIENPRRIVDKMPGNLFFLGAISTMFPAAPVIFMDRNPYDIAVSCYFMRFGAGHEYSYRLDWLGKKIRAAQMLSDHFKQVLPNPWIAVSYEKLATEPEVEVRRVLEFLNLPWEPACLYPEEAENSVITASFAQVRKRIAPSSINRWRRYEAHLGPLFDVLGRPDSASPPELALGGA